MLQGSVPLQGIEVVCLRLKHDSTLVDELGPVVGPPKRVLDPVGVRLDDRLIAVQTLDQYGSGHRAKPARRHFVIGASEAAKGSAQRGVA